MRFEINQIVFCVGYNIQFAHGRKTQGGTGLKFMPFGKDTQTDFTILRLKCIEHHKVPGEWDDEPKYDGFIFEASDGTKYVNQYPRAAYGQVSDRCDGLIFLKDRPADLSIMGEFFVAERYLDEILDGVRHLNKSLDPEDAVRVVLLNNYYKYVAEQLRAADAKIETGYDCKIAEDLGIVNHVITEA